MDRRLQLRTHGGALGGQTRLGAVAQPAAPEFVEVTRTAATLCSAYWFTIHGPRAVRSLVVLRRLPPAPPDTPIRAIAAILRAAPELDPAGLTELCNSDEPFVAGAAGAAASYL